MRKRLKKKKQVRMWSEKQEVIDYIKTGKLIDMWYS